MVFVGLCPVLPEGTPDAEASLPPHGGVTCGASAYLASIPESRIQYLTIDLLYRTERGMTARRLYEIGTFHDWHGDDDLYGHEISRLATVADAGFGFLPFDVLRSALDAAGMLGSVRERSVEIGRRASRYPARNASTLLLTEIAQAIALLDGGVPGRTMIRHLMQVHVGAAAARLSPMIRYDGANATSVAGTR